MTDEAEVIIGISPQTEQVAVQRAKDRAGTAKWDLNIAIFLFAILIMVIILAIYTKVGIEIVAPVAVFGLAMVWLEGWRRGRQLYQRFYDEELLKMEQELKKTVTGSVKETIEETIDKRIEKALRERRR